MREWPESMGEWRVGEHGMGDCLILPAHRITYCVMCGVNFVYVCVQMMRLAQMYEMHH